ncbi:MAG: BREX-4 system phosphatase PglZ [Candidatus Cloacimonas sp.]
MISTTLNRFPVRFILVPTFNELRQLVNYFISNRIPLVKIESLLPHKDGWPSVDIIINSVKNISETTALIPLSEVLRFSKKDEFNNVLNSIAQQMSQDSYRIFVPIVGLSQRFKTQFYNTFSRKSNWPDVYLLCDKTTKHIVVKHLPIQMLPQNNKLIANKTIITSTSDWFKLWCNPVTSSVYCTSALLFHKSIEFQPDEYIDKRDVVSFTEVIKEIYDIDVTLAFKDEESEYVELMIDYLNDKGLFNVTEQALYSMILNVSNEFDLDDEKVVNLLISSGYEQEKLKTWLITKLVIEDYVKVGQYLKNVISKIKIGFNLTEFIDELWFNIFKWDIPRTLDLADRLQIINFIYKHYAMIPLPDENRLKLYLDTVLSSEMQLQTKLKYFTCVTNTEKEQLVKIYSDISAKDEQMFWDTIQPVYPDFYTYAKWDYINQEEEWIANYFKAYVISKARNVKSDILSEILSKVSKDHESFWTWYHELFSRRPAISGSQIVWIDGLGIEWLPVFLKSLLTIGKTYGYIVDEVIVASCNLPSTTNNNRYEHAEKIDLLDQYIHNQCPYKYPQDLVREINLVNDIAKSIFQLGKDDEFWIVSDHGFTFLSQKKFGIAKKYNIKNAEHDGRYFISDSLYTEDRELLSITDENGVNIVMSLTHNSLLNVPCREVHGGCTPEEIIIPFIRMKKQMNSGKYDVRLISTKVTVKNPIISFVINPTPKTVSLKIELQSKCVIVPVKCTNGQWQSDIREYFKPGDYNLKLEIDSEIYEFSIQIVGGMKERDLI